MSSVAPVKTVASANVAPAKATSRIIANRTFAYGVPFTDSQGNPVEVEVEFRGRTMKSIDHQIITVKPNTVVVVPADTAKELIDKGFARLAVGSVDPLS